MIKPEVLWKGSVTPDQIDASILPPGQSNRAIDPQVEGKLKEAWEKQLADAKTKGKQLYDGISYRLEDFSESVNHGLRIVVSPMNFSVRSTLKKRPELEELGPNYYSHGLSVGGFVETSDGFFVFAVKSSRSSSSLTRDLVGGVLEEIEPPTGEGIFNCNRKELNEEINVGPQEIEDMKIIGIVRSSTTDVVIVTHTKLRINREQLIELFEKREDKELDAIEVVEAENLNGFLDGLGGYKPVMKGLLDKSP